MSHPLESLPADKRNLVFILLLVATLAIMAILNFEGLPMITLAAPSGIVSFELAGSPAKAQQILASWDAAARLSAAFSLGFDYLFMLAYSTALGLGCLLAAGVLRLRHWPLAGLGVTLAWGAWLAAAFDATENLALILQLFGNLASPWPWIAAICAACKFALILASMLYIFYGLASRLFAPKPSTAASR